MTQNQTATLVTHIERELLAIALFESEARIRGSVWSWESLNKRDRSIYRKRAVKMYLEALDEPITT